MTPSTSHRFSSSHSDARLVSRVRSGDDAAFAAIVHRYRGELLAHARRLNCDGAAEDVVQQAFLSALPALRTGREVRHLRAWLHQIVRHTAFRMRAPRDSPLDGLDVPGESLEELAERRATARSALAGLSRLPGRQREALIGTAVNGFARAEIARSMGLSEGAVRQLVHRARRSVRAAAGALTPYPLARWFATVRAAGAIPPEAAVGTGAASAAGVVVKIGALVAAGVAATGIATLQVRAPHGHRVHVVKAPQPRRTAIAAAPVRPLRLARAGIAVQRSGARPGQARPSTVVQVAAPRAALPRRSSVGSDRHRSEPPRASSPDRSGGRAPRRPISAGSAGGGGPGSHVPAEGGSTSPGDGGPGSGSGGPAPAPSAGGEVSSTPDAASGSDGSPSGSTGSGDGGGDGTAASSGRDVRDGSGGGSGTDGSGSGSGSDGGSAGGSLSG